MHINLSAPSLDDLLRHSPIIGGSTAAKADGPKIAWVDDLIDRAAGNAVLAAKKVQDSALSTLGDSTEAIEGAASALQAVRSTTTAEGIFPDLSEATSAQERLEILLGGEDKASYLWGDTGLEVCIARQEQSDEDYYEDKTIEQSTSVYKLEIRETEILWYMPNIACEFYVQDDGSCVASLAWVTKNGGRHSGTELLAIFHEIAGLIHPDRVYVSDNAEVGGNEFSPYWWSSYLLRLIRVIKPGAQEAWYESKGYAPIGHEKIMAFLEQTDKIHKIMSYEIWDLSDMMGKEEAKEYIEKLGFHALVSDGLAAHEASPEHYATAKGFYRQVTLGDLLGAVELCPEAGPKLAVFEASVRTLMDVVSAVEESTTLGEALALAEEHDGELYDLSLRRLGFAEKSPFSDVAGAIFGGSVDVPENVRVAVAQLALREGDGEAVPHPYALKYLMGNVDEELAKEIEELRNQPEENEESPFPGWLATEVSVTPAVYFAALESIATMSMGDWLERYCVEGDRETFANLLESLSDCDETTSVRAMCTLLRESGYVTEAIDLGLIAVGGKGSQFFDNIESIVEEAQNDKEGSDPIRNLCALFFAQALVVNKQEFCWDLTA